MKGKRARTLLTRLTRFSEPCLADANLPYAPTTSVNSRVQGSSRAFLFRMS
jgi:hypothetical protein